MIPFNRWGKMALAEVFRLLWEAGFLAAVFIAGALAVILAIFGSRRMADRISPKMRDAAVGLGLAFMGTSLAGYAISFWAGREMVPPPATVSPPTSPPTSIWPATVTPDAATPMSSPVKHTPPYTSTEGTVVQGDPDDDATPLPPGGSVASLPVQCDPPVYHGVRHCTTGAIHILRIDLTAPQVRFETVLPQGYDRYGNFGECRDVSIPQDSTGPGCQVRGRYPVELVDEMVERYPGAVAAFNADFFGRTSGPDGLCVKNGVRLDGVYGDHDEKEVMRSSLSISRDGDVRIGIVDRSGLPNPAEPWTWRPDPLAYYSSVGGIPLLVQDGEPVDIVRQCVIETSPDRSGCPPSEKRCDVGTRLYVGKCPDPNDERARTAVGRTADRQLIVLVVPESDGLTLYQLRDTLLGLGAIDAMNLDGGRSSQLWYDGDYLVAPVRPVASALLVFSEVR
jgi:hypothetical protein